jgi:phosphopantetheinyl transferase
VDEIPFRAWDEAVAPYILREPEWRTWRGLRPAARRRWMRGRVAAKDAIRQLLLARYHVVAPLETICIVSDEHGQPHATCAAVPNASRVISLSISHAGNSSVALAAERGKRCRAVGIDVAPQGDNHDGLEEGGFAPDEAALLGGLAALEREDWLLRLWCAKEATGKALGLGLMGNPLNYIGRRVNRTRGAVEVEPRADGALDAVYRGPARITAHVGCGRGMAFAVARVE